LFHLFVSFIIHKSVIIKQNISLHALDQEQLVN